MGQNNFAASATSLHASATSLHELLYKAAQDNDGKEGKLLILQGASIYDPIDNGVSLAQNPLTLYAQNGRNKTVNDILSSSVTRDESRTSQLIDVVRHIETAGVNGQSIVSGGLGSMLDQDNAEFLKQNMDHYISKKIVSDYNNLRMLKRVEQLPVAIAVYVDLPVAEHVAEVNLDLPEATVLGGIPSTSLPEASAGPLQTQNQNQSRNFL